MKTFDRIAAQGDFLITRIDEIPADVEPYQAEGGKYIVAHSETGHNHTMVMDRVTAFRPKETRDEDLYRLFFEVEAPADIVHERSHDTHETLRVSPGRYEVRRQREYTSEGFRRAAD
jgi:hypothetical protein